MSKNPKGYDKKYRSMKLVNRLRRERDKKNQHNKGFAFDCPDEIV